MHNMRTNPKDVTECARRRSRSCRLSKRYLVMKHVIAFIAGTLLATLAWGQTAAPDSAKEPRDLGYTAVMHVYWYVPKTSEITHVETYLFKDEAACRGSIQKALLIAMPHAAEGDLVSAQCVGMHPSNVGEPRKEPDGSTTL